MLAASIHARGTAADITSGRGWHITRKNRSYDSKLFLGEGYGLVEVRRVGEGGQRGSKLRDHAY